MKVRLVNGMLATILVLFIAGVWLLNRDFTARNVEILPGMLKSIPHDSQTEHTVFSESTLNQPDSAGTISRSLLPFHFKKTAEDALRAGAEVSDPMIDYSRDGEDRGVSLFTTYCQPCHGTSGAGDGIITRHGFPPPPTLLADKAFNLKDGQLFHIISVGQGNMPSLASQISPEDRWLIVRRVRDLQRKGRPLSKHIAAQVR